MYFRPQLLVLFKLDENLEPKYPKMVEFAAQLKAGMYNSLSLSCIRIRTTCILNESTKNEA